MPVDGVKSSVCPNCGKLHADEWTQDDELYRQIMQAKIGKIVLMETLLEFCADCRKEGAKRAAERIFEEKEE